jgi:hypothetical protein
MKTVRNLFVVAFMLVTFTNMASPRLGVDVLIISHEVFYFKVDEGWLGGEVDVVGMDSTQVSVQKIDKKKMMVDFFDLAPGTYTIIIKKNDNCDCREEFTYIKK